MAYVLHPLTLVTFFSTSGNVLVILFINNLNNKNASFAGWH
jgi:hypothetical protein